MPLSVGSAVGSFVWKWLKRFASFALGVLAGIVIDSTAGAPLHKFFEDRAKQRSAPEEWLWKGDSLRVLWTETALSGAVAEYKRVLTRAPQLKGRAYIGLSRTYSDWTFLRYARGLATGTYPVQALDNAARAQETTSSDSAAAIAMAFAYYANEFARRDRDQTRSWVQTLLAKGYKGADIDYLSWVSDPTIEAKWFLGSFRPDSTSNLPVLMDVALSALSLAQGGGNERRAYLSFGERFLNRAAEVQRANPVVQYGLGYRAGTLEQAELAKQYLLSALSEEPDFPKARDELGYAYVLQGNYAAAVPQFKEAANALAAPGFMRRTWLHNWGSAALEAGDQMTACKAWQMAASIDGSTTDPFAMYGLAMCSYLNHQDEALPYFLRAVELGRTRGYDFLSLDSLRRLKNGPKELEIDKALIEMAKRGQ